MKTEDKEPSCHGNNHLVQDSSSVISDRSCLTPPIEVKTEPEEYSLDPLLVVKTELEGSYDSDEGVGYPSEIDSGEGDSQARVRKTSVERRNTRGGGNSLECVECGKPFTKRSQLIMHERIHTGEKPFKCDECGKCFSQKVNLKEHMKVHTGEKCFKCPECGMEFSHKSCLVRHIRVHTGEKPFSCTECDKAFSERGKLKKHLMTHTQEKPFQCSVCGKVYSRKDHLKRHENTHNG